MYNGSNNQKLDQKKCTYETKLGFRGPLEVGPQGARPVHFPLNPSLYYMHVCYIHVLSYFIT